MLVLMLCLVPMGGCPWFQLPGTTDNGGTDDGGTDDGGTDDGGTDDGGTDDGGTDDGGTDDGGTDTAGLTIVKTGITMRHDAGLRVGDDLIAFGTDTLTGVSYIMPSTTPTAGTAVPDNTLYASKGFAVGGKTIFLVGSNSGSLAFQVSVLDTTTGTITKTYDPNEIRLASIPVAANDTGHIQADGNYCVVICDENEVADGKVVKVIDVSGAAPALVAFDNNPADRVDQVTVDATTQKAIAAADDTFYVYDITNPTAAPTEIVSTNGIGDVQMQVCGSYLIALDDQSYPQAILVDLAGGTIITMTDAEAIFDVAINNEIYAFFADYDADDSSGGHQRTAVGTVPQTSFSKVALDQYIDGSTTNNGLVGFGASMTIPPGKMYVFLAGWYLQYSTGGTSFTVPADPDGVDSYGCPAWDIHSSSNTVGFKTGQNRSSSTDTTVGYIILN